MLAQHLYCLLHLFRNKAIVHSFGTTTWHHRHAQFFLPPCQPYYQEQEKGSSQDPLHLHSKGILSSTVQGFQDSAYH